MALEELRLPRNLCGDGRSGPPASEAHETADRETQNRPAEGRGAGPVIGPWGIPDGVDCPLCGNRGVLCRRDENGRLLGSECGCMVRRRNNLRLARSGLKDMVDRYTFEAFQTPEPWQAEAKAKALRYAGQPGGWFLAAGAVGTGKTHLCTAICAALMAAGIETRYLLWRDTAARAKLLVNSDAAGYQELVRPLKEVPALYIDDLFKTGRERDRITGEWKPMVPTAGDVSLAFELLNARYCDSGKLTVISTQLSLAALMDADEALGSRIFERCGGHMVLSENRDNWRLRSRAG